MECIPFQHAIVAAFILLGWDSHGLGFGAWASFRFEGTWQWRQHDVEEGRRWKQRWRQTGNETDEEEQKVDRSIQQNRIKTEPNRDGEAQGEAIMNLKPSLGLFGLICRLLVACEHKYVVQVQDFVDMTDCRAPRCVSNTRLSKKAIRCKGTPGRGEDT